MSKTKRHTVELSETELSAAFIACSNYTPRSGPWKQSAQSRAATRIRMALIQADRKQRGPKGD